MVSLKVVFFVVHITISIFPEKDNKLFSFPQLIMGSLLCALVCLCKVLWVFVHSFWTVLWGQIIDMEEPYVGLFSSWMW